MGATGQPCDPWRRWSRARSHGMLLALGPDPLVEGPGTRLPVVQRPLQAVLESEAVTGSDGGHYGRTGAAGRRGA